MHLRLVAAHGAGPRPHVVGDDPVGALGAALSGGVGDEVLGLGGEADDEARTLRVKARERGEDVRVLGELQHGLAFALLLELVGRLVGCAPIGDGGSANGDIGWADIAICAAAVADWRAADEATHKLKKQGERETVLKLAQNPDILATVAGLGAKRPRLVIGFAAETENLLANAAAKRRAKGADWI